MTNKIEVSQAVYDLNKHDPEKRAVMIVKEDPKKQDAPKKKRKPRRKKYGADRICPRIMLKSDDVHPGPESQFQRACEEWLEERGYHRRGNKSLQKMDDLDRGWYVHVHQAQKNPIMLDLLLLGSDGRYLEIELKVRNGTLRLNQKIIIDNDTRCFAVDNMTRFQEIVCAWEQDSNVWEWLCDR